MFFQVKLLVTAAKKQAKGHVLGKYSSQLFWSNRACDVTARVISSLGLNRWLLEGICVKGGVSRYLMALTLLWPELECHWVNTAPMSVTYFNVNLLCADGCANCDQHIALRIGSTLSNDNPFNTVPCQIVCPLYDRTPWKQFYFAI